jgi:SAM-dependent methyltransferase
MSHDERMRAIYAGELPTRVDRPLPSYRVSLIDGFIADARQRGASSVLEVGCGAGRDGVRLRDAGLAYVGTDLSPVGVRLCLGMGLNAVEASAIALPFADSTFDSGWSMSTLMHLPGEEIETAVAELGRVIRPGGLLEVGLWGASESHAWTDESGRYFRLRTDDEIRAILGVIGEVEGFAVMQEHSDGGHYQWSRVRIG